jgi:hypothetical protein
MAIVLKGYVNATWGFVEFHVNEWMDLICVKRTVPVMVNARTESVCASRGFSQDPLATKLCGIALKISTTVLDEAFAFLRTLPTSLPHGFVLVLAVTAV